MQYRCIAKFIRASIISNKFIEIDRTTPIDLLGAMAGWLDQNRLALFVVEVLEQLDTQGIEAMYRCSGIAAYSPRMMLALAFYC